MFRKVSQMLNQLKELLQNVFNTQKNYQHCLDAYIASKNPTSPAEVDYLIREFDRYKGFMDA